MPQPLTVGRVTDTDSHALFVSTNANEVSPEAARHPMRFKQALDKIVKDIKSLVLNDISHPSLYVGKTDNIGRRTEEHASEGFAYTLYVAKGSSEIISDLEESLIINLKDTDGCMVLNKETSSLGNVNATCLYLCIDISHPNDELCEYDEIDLLGSEYPLSVY